MSAESSVSRLLQFRDARPPRAIQQILEHHLMARLHPSRDGSRLVYHGTVAVNGATCRVELTFGAALPSTQVYSLHLDMTWPGSTPEVAAYHRHSAPSWFDLWTRDFTPSGHEGSGSNDSARYEALVTEALAAEAAEGTVEAVQARILAAVRAGATFTTSHKEGGTTIAWRGGKFVRADYGESDARESFPDDAAFLAFLWRFFEWEVRRGSGSEPAELERWQLIARLLRPAAEAAARPAPRGFERGSPLLIGLVVAFIAAMAMGAVVWSRGAWTQPPKYQKLDTFDGRPPRVSLPPKWSP